MGAERFLPRRRQKLTRILQCNLDDPKAIAAIHLDNFFDFVFNNSVSTPNFISLVL